MLIIKTERKRWVWWLNLAIPVLRSWGKRITIIHGQSELQHEWDPVLKNNILKCWEDSLVRKCLAYKHKNPSLVPRTYFRNKQEPKKKKTQPGIVAHTCYISVREGQTYGSLGFLPNLLSTCINFWASERPCLDASVDDAWTGTIAYTCMHTHVHIHTCTCINTCIHMHILKRDWNMITKWNWCPLLT